VSEQFVNSTSAQLGYTVPFTSVHAGIYGTDDKLKTAMSYHCYLTVGFCILAILLADLAQPRKSKQHKIQQNKTSLA